MSLKIKSLALASLWSIVLSVPALAQNNFNSNAAFGTAGQPPVVTNWGFAGLWSGGIPASGQGDINITNQFLQDATITNVFSANNGSLNFLRIISGNAGLASSNVTVIITSNVVTQFGFQIGSNSTLIVANTSTFGNNQNTAFDLGRTASKGLGTLIISNGASVFLNFTNAIRNDGTIVLLTATAGQTSQINYGQNNGATFTNNVGGTIVKLGSTGTGSFIGEFGGANKSLLNQGTITVTGGTLRLDPRDAFNNGGFRNTSFVQVDSNSVMEIRRTTNAWTNAGAHMPTNSGTIFMNGGELRTLDQNGATPGTNTARIIVIASGGVIRGNGLLDFSPRNETGGLIEAHDGTLSAVTSTGNNGSWVSTNYGGAASVLNFGTSNFDVGGGTLLNSNGTIRLTSGANLTISTSYRQNWGTIDFAGVGILWAANSALANSFTNEFVIKKTAPGVAAIITGFGSGTNNFGFYNRGTLDLSTSGRFSINTSNSFSQPFQNSGNVFIGNVSTLRIVRTSAAWTGATSTSPTNTGTITLSDGVLETADDSGVNAARFLRNAGTISGTGTISASITNASASILAPGQSIGTLNVGGAVVFTSNSTFAVELSPVAGSNDVLAVTGNATLTADSILNITGGAVGNVYTVMTSSAVSGTFGTNSPSYNVNYGATTVTIEPVPLTSIITGTATGNGSIAPTAVWSSPTAQTRGSLSWPIRATTSRTWRWTRYRSARSAATHSVTSPRITPSTPASPSTHLPSPPASMAGPAQSAPAAPWASTAVTTSSLTCSPRPATTSPMSWSIPSLSARSRVIFSTASAPTTPSRSRSPSTRTPSPPRPAATAPSRRAVPSASITRTT